MPFPSDVAPGDNIISSQLNGVIDYLPPVGTVVCYGGASAPTNWLICDGSAINRTTYATLFAIIGTTFGVGDGSTTFNLPDLEGKLPLGKDGSHALGSTGGNFTIVEANLPSHAHSISASGTHVHTMDYYRVAGDIGAGSVDYVNNIGDGTGGGSATGEAGGDHNHGAATGSIGSGTDYKQPYQALNYIIKT